MAVTIISITVINNENATDTGAMATDLNTNINDINANIITCPAVMLANKRIIKEIGFTNIPIISIGIKNIFMGTGTPGIQKMCFQ